VTATTVGREVHNIFKIVSLELPTFCSQVKVKNMQWQPFGTDFGCHYKSNCL